MRLFKLKDVSIKLPTLEEAEIIASQFKKKSWNGLFDRVGGIIDGTHMGIFKPKLFVQDYYNRKQFNSFKPN